ncbi:MAG: hypothetical protein AAFP28_03150 [Pseudomonadota bacterium]
MIRRIVVSQMQSVFRNTVSPMEEYSLNLVEYWRGVTCAFLTSAGGERHLAAKYSEEYPLQSGAQVGSNRFLFATPTHDPDGALCFWDFRTQRAYRWFANSWSSERKSFMWHGDVQVSPCKGFAALCGGIRGERMAAFILDIEAKTLREYTLRGEGFFLPLLRSVRSAEVFSVTNGRAGNLREWLFDVNSKTVLLKETHKEGYVRSSEPDWIEPTSSEAARMKVSLPVELEFFALSYERYVIDSIPQNVSGSHSLFDRLNVTRLPD